MNAVKTDLKAALLEYFGFDSFKGEQEKVIANIGALIFALSPGSTKLKA